MRVCSKGFSEGEVGEWERVVVDLALVVAVAVADASWAGIVEGEEEEEVVVV